MAENYEQLEKEFKKKVAELKKNCKHKNLTPWSDEWWAIGHSTGFQVRACKRCREIIKRRIACMDCGKITEDYVGGDGQRRPAGEYLCKECDEKAIKKLKLIKCEECTTAYYTKTKAKKSLINYCPICSKKTKHKVAEKK